MNNHGLPRSRLWQKWLRGGLQSTAVNFRFEFRKIDLTVNPAPPPPPRPEFSKFLAKCKSFPGSKSLSLRTVPWCTGFDKTHTQLSSAASNWPIGFFNPVFPSEIFPRSRNSHGFLGLSPIPNIRVNWVDSPIIFGKLMEDSGGKKGVHTCVHRWNVFTCNLVY